MRGNQVAPRDRNRNSILRVWDAGAGNSGSTFGLGRSKVGAMEARDSVTLASRNAKKADELRALLGEGWGVRCLIDFPGIPDVVEDGATFADNAVKKARSISEHLDGLVLADDSGLEVDALNGAPGVLSARFAGRHGDDAANNALLLKKLEGLPIDRRGAQFRCVLAIARAGGVLFTCEGICRGRIGFECRGTAGFGYDPLFVPEWEGGIEGHGLVRGRTFAEISSEEKNSRSHRGLAMRQLRDRLDKMGLGGSWH